MKFTKHHHAALIGTGYNSLPLAADGHTFSFPEYPTVQLFVFKHPATKLYYVREMRTGLKAGTDSCGSKTRAAAVANQLKAFEDMRYCPRGKGKHAYVAAKVEECVASWIKNRDRAN